MYSYAINIKNSKCFRLPLSHTSPDKLHNEIEGKKKNDWFSLKFMLEMKNVIGNRMIWLLWMETRESHHVDNNDDEISIKIIQLNSLEMNFHENETVKFRAEAAKVEKAFSKRNSNDGKYFSYSSLMPFCFFIHFLRFPFVCSSAVIT